MSTSHVTFSQVVQDSTGEPSLVGIEPDQLFGPGLALKIVRAAPDLNTNSSNFWLGVPIGVDRRRLSKLRMNSVRPKKLDSCYSDAQVGSELVANQVRPTPVRRLSTIKESHPKQTRWVRKYAAGRSVVNDKSVGIVVERCQAA